MEFMLLEDAVDMKLCKLERALIHALLLCVINFGTVRYMLELFFDEFGRERCELFKSDDKGLLISRERI